MQLKDIFLSISRETLQTLVKYRLLRPNILVWYDLIRFFDSIDLSEEAHRRRLSKLEKPVSQMDKYIITGNKYNLSDEQVRKVVSRLNRYV